MIYKTSLDRTAKVITGIVTILFAVVIIAQFLVIKNGEIKVSVFIIILLSLIYFGTFLYRPISYILSEVELIIHRSIGDIKINRTEIKTIEQLDNTKLKWSVRVFGVGGLFGYWGKFSNSKIGSMTWYATRRNKAVLITTFTNKKIILTPNEPEKFIANYNRQVL